MALQVDDRSSLEQRVRVRQELQIRAARENVPDFISYAIRNEADDTVIRNAPFHREWQSFLDGNKYAVLIASVEHGKTVQIAAGRLLHTIGRDPDIRLALISNTSPQAQKPLRAIRSQIERNPRVQKVFPHLRPSENPEDPWHATQITVQRNVISRDPTIQAMGVFGPIVGSRLDGVVLDDVLDFENTRTEQQRKKLIEWFDTTVFTRIVEGGFIWAVGTPWHPEDLLHYLEKLPSFAAKRFGAVRNPDDPPERWKPLWIAQWPLPRLLERRKNSTDSTFNRKYLCRVRLDSTSRFRQIWLDRMLIAGKGRTFLPHAPSAHLRGPALPCFSGVDLGIGQEEEHALTVIFTIALLPDTRRLVVEIESGKWQSPEIIDRLVSVYRRFNSEILVEDNGAQAFLVQNCQGRVPVQGYTTTAQKKHNEHYGVESLAVELRNGLWVCPSGADGKTVHPEAHQWMQGLLYYDPETHTPDRVMAGWLARECLRRYAMGRTRIVNTQGRGS